MPLRRATASFLAVALLVILGGTGTVSAQTYGGQFWIGEKMKVKKLKTVYATMDLSEIEQTAAVFQGICTILAARGGQPFEPVAKAKGNWIATGFSFDSFGNVERMKLGSGKFKTGDDGVDEFRFDMGRLLQCSECGKFAMIEADPKRGPRVTGFELECEGGCEGMFCP